MHCRLPALRDFCNTAAHLATVRVRDCMRGESRNSPAINSARARRSCFPDMQMAVPKLATITKTALTSCRQRLRLPRQHLLLWDAQQACLVQEEHDSKHGCNFGDLGLQSSRWGQGAVRRELSDFWAIEQSIVVSIVACCWRGPEALALH